MPSMQMHAQGVAGLEAQPEDMARVATPRPYLDVFGEQSKDELVVQLQQELLRAKAENERHRSKGGVSARSALDAGAGAPARVQ